MADGFHSMQRRGRIFPFLNFIAFPKFTLDFRAWVVYPIAHMVANISEDLTLGAKNPAEFSTALASLISENNRLKSMAESSPDLSALTKRIEALEAKPNLTEARVGELVTAGVTPAITSWAGSEVGKKAIGSEASRITMEAMAAIGTQPVKPSPAPVVTGNSFRISKRRASLLKPMRSSRELRAEFPDAGSYAAYRKNAHKVRIRTATNLYFMSQLTANTPLTYEVGDLNAVPVKGSSEIFLGSAVGITAGLRSPVGCW
jgi:hypothetical protein